MDVRFGTGVRKGGKITFKVEKEGKQGIAEGVD